VYNYCLSTVVAFGHYPAGELCYPDLSHKVIYVRTNIFITYISLFKHENHCTKASPRFPYVIAVIKEGTEAIYSKLILVY
jgi:hypothetical protein